MSTGAWVFLVAVVGALAFGLWRAATDGRFRGTRSTGVPRPVRTVAAETADAAEASDPAETADEPRTPTVWDSVAIAGATDVAPGQRATLVQFSSAFCAPCRATRRILTEVAEVVPGVVHVEIDAEHHLELVRELGIARTPTTLVLGPSGTESTRAVGAPKKDQVLQALSSV